LLKTHALPYVKQSTAVVAVADVATHPISSSRIAPKSRSFDFPTVGFQNSVVGALRSEKPAETYRGDSASTNAATAVLIGGEVG